MEYYSDNQPLLTIVIDSMSKSFSDAEIIEITGGALTTAVELADLIVESLEYPSESHKVVFGKDSLTIFYDV